MLFDMLSKNAKNANLRIVGTLTAPRGEFQFFWRGTMHTIGISISRDRICAVVLEGSMPGPRVAASVYIPCAEPYGTPGDAVALSEEWKVQSSAPLDKRAQPKFG